MRLKLRNKQNIFLITVLIAVLAFLYFIVVPKLINIEKYRPQIEKAIKENVEAPISLGKLSLSTTIDLRARVKVDNINIKQANKTKFISTGPAYVEIPILSLLRKKVILKKINVDNVTAYIIRQKNGRFNIDQLIPKKAKKPPKYKVLLDNTDIIVNNYKLFLKDDYIHPPQNFTISGNSIKVLHLTPDKFIEVQAKGQISMPEKASTVFDINFRSKLPFNKNFLQNKIFAKGQVQNLYPEIFLSYINKYTSYKYSDLSGSSDLKFNIDLRSSGNRKNKFYVEGISKNIYAVRTDKPAKLDIPEKTNFLINGNINSKILNFRTITFKNKKLDVKAYGNIKNYKTKRKILDLRLIVKNSRIESIISTFPKDIKIPLDPFRKLSKYNLKGNAWADMTIKGYYRKPKMQGYAKYNDFSIITESKKIPKGSGTVNFLGKTLSLDTKTFVDPTGYVLASGSIKPFFGRSLNLDVNSNEIDLERGQSVLLAIRDIFNFKLGPVVDMKLKGTGKVSLNIKGKFKLVDLTGYVDVLKGWVSYTELSKPAHDVIGTLLFKGDRILYNNITGLVETSRAIVSGYTTLRLNSFSDVKINLPKIDLKAGHELIADSILLEKLAYSLRNTGSTSGTACGVINIAGTEKYVSTKGNLFFNKAILNYKGLSEPLKDISGELKFVNDKVFLNKIKLNIADSPVIAKGILQDDQVNIVLTSSRLDLAKIRNLISTSPVLVLTEKSLKDITGLSGYAAAKLRLAGNINSKAVFKDLELNFFRANLLSQTFGIPIEILNGKALITLSSISTQGLETIILDSPIRFTGQVTGLPDKVIPKINLIVRNFDFPKIKRLAQSKILPKEFSEYLALFKDLQGKINANIDILPNRQFRTNLDFNNISLVYIPADIPFRLRSGGLVINPEKFGFRNLYMQASKSFVYLDGVINNYQSSPDLNLLVSTKVNSEDVDKYINPYLDEKISTKGTIPVAAIIKGNLSNWDLLAQMTLNKGSNIFYKEDIGLPEDKIRIFSLKAAGTEDKINIENLELAAGDTPIEVGISASPQPEIPTNLERLLQAKGQIIRLNTDNPEFDNFHILTPNPISIKILNPAIKVDNDEAFFKNGEFKVDLMLEGKITSPDMLGKAALTNVEIPSRQTLINYANIDINENQIILNDSSVNIADSQARINATIVNNFDLPLVVNTVTINSPYLNIDKITKAFNGNNKSQRIGDRLPPVVVSNGTINAKELVINNLITTNILSSFNFTPDWILTIPDLSFDTAGGTAQGEIVYNLDTTDVSVDLKAQGMQANAAATTLLNLPNEVYGTLSGTAKFVTRGNTSNERIANSNGSASFEVIDGRLVRLGSLEYLLRAANVAYSGIAGLNLNNIIDLVIPQKTGYFDTLNGNVSVTNGILTTNNINSKGKNLSLLLTGNLDINTNNADITIFGKLSKKVSGLLGPLGSLSINTFIDFIPGIGFLPTSPERGLLDLIPGLNKIPILGLGRGKYRHFIVRIEGDLYDPNSVRSFRWVD